MKKWLFGLFFGMFVLISPSLVLADAAPAKPSYLNTKINVNVSLGSFSDRYVIVEHNIKRGDFYELVIGTTVSPEGYGAVDYLAIDKDFFEKNGGVEGIFINTAPADADWSEMKPKDSDSFNSHRYDFVLLKDDNLLEYRFGDREYRNGRKFEIIDGKYIKFPFKSDFYIRKGTDDEDCATGYSYGTKECNVGEETWNYSATQVVGKNIILSKSDKTDTFDSVASITDQPNNQNNEVGLTELQTVSVSSNLSSRVDLFSFVKSFFSTDRYLYQFLFYLVVTLSVEIGIVFLLLRKFFKIGQQYLSSKKVLLVTIFASMLTLPYVWFVFPYLLANFTLSIIISEIFALVIETIFYRLFFNLSVKNAFAISFAANLMSFIIGLLLNFVI